MRKIITIHRSCVSELPSSHLLAFHRSLIPSTLATMIMMITAWLAPTTIHGIAMHARRMSCRTLACGYAVSFRPSHNNHPRWVRPTALADVDGRRSSYSQSRATPRSTRASMSSSSDGDKDNKAAIAASTCKSVIDNAIDRQMRIHVLDAQTDNVLLLCVSGGSDSMALLHAMIDWSERQAAPTNAPHLHVHHFNHQQRGAESDLDQQLVETVCEASNVDCHTHRWNETSSSSFSQEIARNWRRQTCVDFIATQYSATSHVNAFIMTAHHREDSYESMLLKLLRGVHISNLQGMDCIATAGVARSPNLRIQYFRPFLELTKDQLRDYLLEQKHAWREDKSNASPKYLRNRVRNELMPLMQDIMASDGEQPQRDALHERLDVLQEQTTMLRDDIQQRVRAYLSQSGSALPWKDLVSSDSPNMTPLLQNQILRQWMVDGIHSPSASISYSTLSRVWKQLVEHPQRREWKLEVGANYFVCRKGDVLVLEDRQKQESDGSFRVMEWSIVLPTTDKETNETTAETTRETTNDFMQPLTIHAPAHLLAQGDWQLIQTTIDDWPATLHFVPHWRRGRSPIKMRQFLRGQGIPLHERGSTSVLLFVPRRDDASAVVVAARLGREWLVHADFGAGNMHDNDGGNDDDGSVTIAVHIT